MSYMGIFTISLLLILCSMYAQGDLENDYSQVVGEYKKFMGTLRTFRHTKQEMCEEFEEYDQVKTALETFIASRDDFCKLNRVHKDCSSIKEAFPDASDGVYRITPRDGKPSFLAYCDMTGQDGGWLVIQRRQDGSEDFYRTWFEYMDGFGNLTGEFWLGNEKLHRLTNQMRYELRVDLENSESTLFAEYGYFRVGNMSEFYKLTVDGYSGTAIRQDGLSYHNNSRFSAKNLDLDTWINHCAQSRHGAWWFKNCAYSHLNGVYTQSGDSGVYWNGVNFKKSTIKIRPTH